MKLNLEKIIEEEMKAVIKEAFSLDQYKADHGAKAGPTPPTTYSGAGDMSREGARPASMEKNLRAVDAMIRVVEGPLRESLLKQVEEDAELKSAMRNVRSSLEDLYTVLDAKVRAANPE